MVDAIRRLKPEDLDALSGLDAACFDRPWPQAHLAEELSNESLGYFSNNQLTGAILGRQSEDEFWIFRIMVDPMMRRKGIAHELLANWVGQSKRPNTIWLEVDATNQSAINFYQSEGFAVVSKRPNYYPPNDAFVMKMMTAQKLDYALLDSGNQLKLERFGNKTLIRPESQATWAPVNPMSSWQADAICEPIGRGQYQWLLNPSPAGGRGQGEGGGFAWPITYGNLTFELRLSQSKNIGIFPEQASNWQWLHETISAAGGSPKVLNLFAYTGAASLVAANAGAQVCHVDAAKSAIDRAKTNQQLSLPESQIRWIVDDAQKFLTREIKRQNRYDGIILDPPPFGRSDNKQFSFNDQALELLRLCSKVLADKPLFLLFNCYAVNFTPEMAKDLLGRVFPKQQISCGELAIIEQNSRGNRLPCSVYARWKN